MVKIWIEEEKKQPDGVYWVKLDFTKIFPTFACSLVWALPEIQNQFLKQFELESIPN